MSKLFKGFGQFGPGIIMASSCVGGSHIIASTQAGAYYGYQLALFIIAVNLLKYPFFNFAFSYSHQHNKNLLQGYAEKGKGYLWVFLAFNLFATVVNIAGGTLLSAVLLAMLLPVELPLNVLNIIVILSFMALLFYHQYQNLDRVSKTIMLLLTVITAVALLVALQQPSKPVTVTFIEPSPWTLSAIPFLIALMGWMPAPMELSVSSSLWVTEKIKQDPNYRHKSKLDFNTGYIVTIILALMFMTLGALVQYGKEITPLSGGKFIHQFVDMYALSIGEWSRRLMALLAFICIYGTTIVAVDGYSRCNQQAVGLLLDRPQSAVIFSEKILRYWIIAACLVAFVIIQFFSGAIGKMVPFAMTASFVSAPVFAWLNLSLVKRREQPQWLWWLAICGLLYLIAMVFLYFAVV
ncbi:Mn2+/Fe2+ NRAMP family transporter [Cricetibacter osteomyelitidis]|uniref:Mn2+/Fe2+ NRAMP family transporter n=1 Tax=Cricetibacter osteomyelitidis TaxID=1521931 RepID=A0A4R2T4H7_9PAST|nr:divalent metal cation transporter [Cricetibacter osteomyelitidis]TCP96226.1 Mn2+/Fe2+ NRAMP family transporter [Cricetibacter osteomyelitidis]